MQEEQHRIYRKIEPDRKYRVWKKTINDIHYYKIQITQKNYDGTSEKYYQEIRFKKGVEVPNQCDIKIKTAYENVRKNEKDEFNPIFYLVITDFEKVETEKQKQQDAFDDFNEYIADIDEQELDLPF